MESAPCSPVRSPDTFRSFVCQRESRCRTNGRRLDGMTAATATCAYPECDRPVAPPPPTGGRSSYCDRPDHNRTTAFAVRRAQATGRTPPASETTAVAQPGTRPAETLAGVADRLRQTLAAIEEELGNAREV